MKINNFQGDLTEISDETKTLLGTALHITDVVYCTTSKAPDSITPRTLSSRRWYSPHTIWNPCWIEKETIEVGALSVDMNPQLIQYQSDAFLIFRIRSLFTIAPQQDSCIELSMYALFESIPSEHASTHLHQTDVHPLFKCCENVRNKLGHVSGSALPSIMLVRTARHSYANQTDLVFSWFLFHANSNPSS